MKKTTILMSLLILGALSGLLFGTAFATSDVVTTSMMGSKVRLLQLETSIAVNIQAGTRAVAYIEENDDEADLTYANLILNEMRLLQEEVRIASNQTYASTQEAAQVFIDFKIEAQNLTSEFRAEVSPYLTSETRAAIRSDAAEQRRLLQEERRARMQIYVQEHNALVLERALNSSNNVEISARISAVREGRMDAKDALLQISQEARNFSTAAKLELRQKIAENTARMNVESARIVEQAQLRREQMHSQAQTRLDVLLEQRAQARAEAEIRRDRNQEERQNQSIAIGARAEVIVR